jgi:hypothetical protein
MQLSGTDTANSFVAVNLSGKLHGGQNGVAYSTVQIYAVGTNGYGGAANLLSTVASGTNQYYPGGALGCNNAAVPVVTYAISGGIATFTSANTMVAGQLVAISDSSPLSGSTYYVTSASTTQFSVSTSNTSTVTTTADTGTATPTCYTNVATDQNGNFTLTGHYSCGSFSASDVYVVASGGNPSNPSTSPMENNSALKMVAPLLTAATPGVPMTCSNLTSATYVLINEATTVAAAFAMGQYFGFSADSFSSPATAQAETGLSNAVSTVGSLVSTATGTPYTSFTISGAGSTLTVVPEASKINTVANILAACVNSAGTSDPVNTSCTTLFANTGGTTPANTLEAAVDMSLNPTSTNATNLGNIYNLSTGVGAPFGNALTAQPSDWTIGIQYQDNAGTFFLKPQNVAVDGLGNVWVLSNSSSYGNLVEVGPTGTPLSNITSLSEYGPFVSPITNPPVLSSLKATSTNPFATQNTVFTTTFGAATNNPSINPRNLAIDPTNNVWFTESSSTSSTTGGSNGTTTIPVNGNVFEIATSPTTGLPTGSTYGFATGKSGYGLAIDAAGNAFMGEQSGSAYFGIYEFPFNATPGNALLTPVAFPPAAPTTIVPEYISIDKTGNKLFTSGSATATAAYQITGANASSCGTLTANNLCQGTGSAYTTLTLPAGATGPYGLAEGTTGTWIANNAVTSNTLELIPFGATSTSTAYGDSSHLVQPRFPAVDGLGNVWVGNATGPNTTSDTTGGSVSALTAAGVFLSPSNGGSTTFAPGFAHLGLNGGAGTAIDPSGNVWLASNAAFTAACSVPVVTPTVALPTGGNTCSSIFELVGAAAPVVTPISVQTPTGPTRP